MCLCASCPTGPGCDLGFHLLSLRLLQPAVLRSRPTTQQMSHIHTIYTISHTQAHCVWTRSLYNTQADIDACLAHTQSKAAKQLFVFLIQWNAWPQNTHENEVSAEKLCGLYVLDLTTKLVCVCCDRDVAKLWISFPSFIVFWETLLEATSKTKAESWGNGCNKVEQHNTEYNALFHSSCLLTACLKLDVHSIMIIVCSNMDDNWSFGVSMLLRLCLLDK